MGLASSVFTIFLLALLGFLGGLLLAKLTRLAKGTAPSHDRAPQTPDQATERRLTQLKQQLDSGLITKEEYQAEKQKISSPGKERL